MSNDLADGQPEPDTDLPFFGVPSGAGLGEPTFSVSRGGRRLTAAGVKYVDSTTRLSVTTLPQYTYRNRQVEMNWLGLQEMPSSFGGPGWIPPTERVYESSLPIVVDGLDATLTTLHLGSSWVGTAELPAVPWRLVLHSVGVSTAVASVLVQLEPPSALPRPVALDDS